MVTVIAVAVVVTIAWIVVAVAIAIIVGRGIDLADRRRTTPPSTRH